MRHTRTTPVTWTFRHYRVRIDGVSLLICSDNRLFSIFTIHLTQQVNKLVETLWSIYWSRLLVLFMCFLLSCYLISHMIKEQLLI